MSSDGQASEGPSRCLQRATARPETLLWNRELLIPPRPAWMDKETYSKLARVRYEL
jgi:hypothetical protein